MLRKYDEFKKSRSQDFGRVNDQGNMNNFCFTVLFD